MSFDKIFDLTAGVYFNFHNICTQTGKTCEIYATDSDLILRGVSLLLYDDAPCLLSALRGVVLSSELQSFEIQIVRGFSCTNFAF